MIVPSLFSSELSNLPQTPQTPAYGPEYFNKVQQYYSGYLPGQTLDTQALSDWYSSSKDIPFGGTYFAPPSSSTAPYTGLLGGDTGGGGGGDSMQSAPSEQLDDAGLAQSYNIDPRSIQGIGLLGTMLGIPFSSLVGGFKNPLADYLTKQSYESAVDKNTALVAAQMGLDPKDPANAPAIAAAIDSLSAANQGTTAATTGPTGTGGAAASVAEQAAANAAALGFGDAAIGAAAQAAANAALSGASQAVAAQAGIDAAISANNVAAGLAAAQEAANQSNSFSGSFGSEAGPAAGLSNEAGSTDATAAADNSGNTSGGGKIVCTAMNQQYGFGSFRNAIWLKYAENNLTKAHEAGYHAVFLPLVDFAFKQGNGKLNLITRKFLENCARHRSLDLRAEMRGTKRDKLGMVYRFVLEPLCYVVGKCKGY